MEVLLGGASQVEEGGQRGKESVPTDAADSLGRSSQVQQGYQGRSMLAATIVAYPFRTVSRDQLGADGQQRPFAT